ncbi:MAG TPA: histidinol-phosphate transaminase [Anaerolineae bacterium]|nr:histidinol-phosphate transaminase [Anaerolineae bacterium]HIP71744.1 histidinol-phosphate transaminase [Anaerolineae bacterium]
MTNKFIRPDIANMEPYTPIVPFEVLSRRLGRPSTEIIKLDANENPYGTSPKALAALANLLYVHIYPDPEATPLREALSAVTAVPQERLLVGAGADELIDLVFRAVLSPGDSVVDCPPSFGMYPFSTAVNAGHYIPIRRKADFRLDVAAIERTVREQRPKLLVICSPNNPDGSVIDDDSLRRLLALPVLVVLDEAYVDFAGDINRKGREDRKGKEKNLAPAAPFAVGHLNWVMEYDNLVLLRTFSKLAGLAGLRVGYGAFPDWLLPHLWKIKQPYNINAAAMAAAVAALDDLAWLHEKARLIVAERERLGKMLAEVDWLRPYPSQANFILCRVDGRDAAHLKLALEQRGILVRYFNKPGLDDCIRISVGRPSDTDILLKALREIGD